MKSRLTMLDPLIQTPSAPLLSVDRNRVLADSCNAHTLSKCVATEIDSKAVLRRVLLQAARHDPDALDRVTVQREIRSAIEYVASLRANWRATSPVCIALSECDLMIVSADFAAEVHRRFHYLGSSRAEGVHLGLRQRVDLKGAEGVLALATLSPLDLPHLEPVLPQRVMSREVLVLSRLFAFPGSPPNTVSYLMGRVFAWLRRERPEVRLLLTYFNPNLAFTGSVYKATNWRHLGREHKKRYLFLDGQYVTDRHMISNYGTGDYECLVGLLGARVERSRCRLKPLDLLAYPIDPRFARSLGGTGKPVDVEPPPQRVGVW
jgi:hypothetical protein